MPHNQTLTQSLTACPAAIAAGSPYATATTPASLLLFRKSSSYTVNCEELSNVSLLGYKFRKYQYPSQIKTHPSEKEEGGRQYASSVTVYNTLVPCNFSLLKTITIIKVRDRIE